MSVDITDNGDGTLSGAVTDNGNGTLTSSDPNITDNGATLAYTQAAKRDLTLVASPIGTIWQAALIVGAPITTGPVIAPNPLAAANIAADSMTASTLTPTWIAGPITRQAGDDI